MRPATLCCALLALAACTNGERTPVQRYRVSFDVEEPVRSWPSSSPVRVTYELPGDGTTQTEVVLSVNHGLLILPASGAEAFNEKSILRRTSGTQTLRLFCGDREGRLYVGEVTLAALFPVDGTRSERTIRCDEVPEVETLTIETDFCGFLRNCPVSVRVGTPGRVREVPYTVRRMFRLETSTPGALIFGGSMPSQSVTTLGVNEGRFGLLYPGDDVTPLTISLVATTVSAQGNPLRAETQVHYARSDERARLEVAEVTPASGTPHVTWDIPGVGIRTFQLHMTEGDAVLVEYSVMERGNGMPRSGGRLDVVCKSALPQNCLGLSASAGGMDGSTPAAAEITTVFGPGDGARKTLTFTAPPGSVPGALELYGYFTSALGGGTVTAQTPIHVNLVEKDRIRLVPEQPAPIASPGLTTLGARAWRGAQPLGGVPMCFEVVDESRSLLTLYAVESAVRMSSEWLETSAGGGAGVKAMSADALARGMANVRITLLDRPFDPAGDARDVPCPAPGTAAAETMVTVGLFREAVLSSVAFMGAEPEVLGVQGSSLPTRARIDFRVTDEEGHTLADQLVFCDLSGDSAEGTTVTPLTLTNSVGIASCRVDSGPVAGHVVVIANATRGLGHATGTSPPLMILAGDGG